MPLDTHNTREKKAKQKLIVGFLKNVMFTSILFLVRGSPSTLQKFRLVARGAKREDERGKGQPGGKKFQQYSCTERINNYGRI
jgi:acylphosphatase